MPNLFFVFVLALLLAGLYVWGFRYLAREQWQFIGAIPLQKEKGGTWRGLNLTYYGLFNACACTLAVTIAYILLAASGLSSWTISIIVTASLAPCVPAAKLMARWVEKKAHTFSIGGAAFVGFITAPWIMMLLNYLIVLFGMIPFPIMSPLAALTVAYALGEGSGRLACISFGCCYGKPIAELPPTWQRLLKPFSVIYRGHTKKIAYADSFCGRPVVAVQAITATLYTTAGIIGCLLYLQGLSHWAYILCVGVTQAWRFFSEFLRADFRGTGTISAYQFMALLILVHAGGVFITVPNSSLPADIIQGLRQLWNPGILFLCQTLWIGIFLYMGRSQVTGSRITFHVRKKHI